jgi:cytochrome c oxidase subunit 2
MVGRSFIAKICVPTLMLAGVVAMSIKPARSQNGPRVIEITAKRFGFSPNQVTVKKGETVVLRLHSEDVTHGFFSRPLKISSDIAASAPTDITITPQAAGTYPVICDHFCGSGHGNMHMSIEVTE